MPIYEYRCDKCNQTFSVKMSMTDHEEGSVTCPSCKESRVTPQLATFFASTSKKS